MPPKKRSKPEYSSSSIITSYYEDYLLHKPLVKKYREPCKLKILPSRYIKYDQLTIYNIHEILLVVGLDKLLDEQRKVPYYPFLVYLFYANLSVTSTADGVQTISTSVKNIRISFNADELAGILKIPSSDVELMSIEHTDQAVNDIMFKPGCTYPMNNKSLNPTAKIIARIVAQNLIPKTGSFDHFAPDKVNAVYAIFAQIKVNWANHFLKSMACKHFKFLPFGCIITLILQHFGVALSNEPKVEPSKEYFDRVSLSRMQLSDSLSDPAKPSSSRSRASTSSTSDICARLDRLETQVSTIQRDVRTILSYQRQSLGIPDPSSSSDSEEGSADGSASGSGSGSASGSDDDGGD